MSLGLRVSRTHAMDISLLNGENAKSNGFAEFSADIMGKTKNVKCMVVNGYIYSDIDIILGNDFIRAVGGILIDGQLRPHYASDVLGSRCAVSHQQFECKEGIREPNRRGVSAGTEEVNPQCKEGTKDLGQAVVQELVIEESDFVVRFDGQKWVLKWKWANGPVRLRNSREDYGMKPESRVLFNKEVEQWIQDKWLVEHNPETHGEVQGYIAFQAKDEPRKKRVRPIMDYRELNSHILSYPGRDSAVCPEKMRHWRQFGQCVTMLDLKKAYLQVHVDEALQPYQAVRYKGKTYLMTRMGFGLSIAPKVMDSVLSASLKADPEIGRATDNYIDDIICNDTVPIERIRAHLSNWGLDTKDPDELDGARVLGLRIQRNGDRYYWSRDDTIEWPEKRITRRELYSLCGRLVGHYPVAGWLRVWTSYLKRKSSDIAWDCLIPEALMDRLNELHSRFVEGDPVAGVWNVPATNKGVIWCDASAISLATCLEIDSTIVEDGCWLRSEEDGSHINTAELEAAIKGINLALKWGLTDLVIKTDSATVVGWLNSVIHNTHRVRTSGITEMLTKRRLGIVEDLIKEYDIQLSVHQVPSGQNLADKLTRVPKSWIKSKEYVAAAISPTATTVSDVHKMHHFGVDKTLYHARKCINNVSRSDVESVVKNCHECASIDPAPIQYPTGELSVSTVWKRLAIDLTHYKNVPFVTFVDCCSRFSIWRRLRGETAGHILFEMKRVFWEYGLPAEILTDNGTNLTSETIEFYLEQVGIVHLLRAAHRPQGNGIVERNNRTIKKQAERSGATPEQIAYFYNHTPNSEGWVPAEKLFAYRTHMPGESFARPPVVPAFDIAIGEEVYVKPGNCRCTTPWEKRKVTGYIDETKLLIDGIPRHISHIRRVPRPDATGNIDDNKANHQPETVQVEPDDNFVRLPVDMAQVEHDVNNGPYVTRYGRAVREPARLTFFASMPEENINSTGGVVEALGRVKCRETEECLER